MGHTCFQLMHGMSIGVDDLVPNSRTMWLGAPRDTCTTGCPQGVDVATVADGAKIGAWHQGIEAAVKRDSKLCLKRNLDDRRCS